MIFFNRFSGKINFGIFAIAPGMSASKTMRRYANCVRSSSVDGAVRKIELRHDNHELRLLFQKDVLVEAQLNWLYEDGTFYRDDDFYDLHLALHIAKVPQIWWDLSSGSEHWVLRPSRWVRLRREAFTGPVIPLVLLLVVYCYPINNGVTRCLILFFALIAWGIIIKSLWRFKKYLGISALALSLAVFFAVALAPEREIPRDELNRIYLEQLRKYDGTRYIWGGEDQRGIDCSGLPRKALRDAQRILGIKTLNFGLIRSSLENWWFDASARALAASYRRYTVPLNLAGTVATAPEEKLKPGDLAITDDGVHVMIYLGPGEWISADPGQGKVVIEHPSQSKNQWFTRPVHFFRWSELKFAKWAI